MKICDTIKILHSFAFPYGLISSKTIKYDFSLRHPPLFYSNKSIPSSSQNDDYLSFSLNEDNIEYDMYAFGLFLYSIVYDVQIENQLTEIIIEDLPSFIQDLTNKKMNKRPSFTPELIDRIKSFIINRHNYIEIR